MGLWETIIFVMVRTVPWRCTGSDDSDGGGEIGCDAAGEEMTGVMLMTVTAERMPKEGVRVEEVMRRRRVFQCILVQGSPKRQNQ